VTPDDEPPHGPHGPGATPPRRGVRSLVAVAAVAALIGALLVFIGSGLRHDSSGSAATTIVPAQVPSQNGGSSQQPSLIPAPSGSSSDGSQGSGSGANQQSAATSKLDLGVVDIDTQLGYQHARAAGTGMIITSDGEVLTNTHVISGATTIKVTLVTSGKTYDAKVLGSDATHDVALLQIEGGSKFDTVKLGDSSSVGSGDAVTAVGNAGGVGGIPSVSTGSVVALDQSINVSDEQGGDRAQLNGLIQTNAALEPGDSGGPLYDAKGEVIGMDTAADAGQGFRSASSESYAIAIDTAKSIVDQITSGKGTDTVQIGPRGFLGVEIDGSAASGNGALGTGSDSGTAGATVADVIDGTPAADAGLQQGDVITQVAGHAVSSNDDLSAALHGFQPGNKVKVTWVSPDDGQQHSGTVTLTTGPVA
jgi:S1-C subfamily serine protease